MTTLYFRKEPGRLVPIDDAGADWMRTVKIGDVVRGSFAKAKNQKLMRKLFALIDLAFASQDAVHTRDAFIRMLKIRVGFFDEFSVEQHGESPTVHYVLKSVADADDAELTQYYSDVLDLVLAEIVPHLNSAQVEAEITKFAQ